MLTFNKQAFLSQFKTSEFWHAIVSEHLESLEQALSQNDALKAQECLEAIDEFIGAPPLFSHADYLLQLEAFKSSISSEMRSLLDSHQQHMREATEAFVSQALGESENRQKKIIGYFIENMAMIVESEGLSSDTRIALLKVIPLRYLRSHPVYQACIEYLQENHKSSVADFLKQQPAETVTLRKAENEVTQAAQTAGLFSIFKAVNVSNLIKAFIFMRQLMPVAAENSEDDEQKDTFKEWVDSLDGKVEVVDQFSRDNLPPTIESLLAESRENNVPFMVYRLNDQGLREIQETWDFNHYGTIENQRMINEIFNKVFIPFVRDKQFTASLNPTSRTVFYAFVKEFKISASSDLSLLDPINMPDEMLAQLCLMDAWFSHTKVDPSHREDNKLIYLVGEERFGRIVSSLKFVQEADEQMGSHCLNAFHQPKDHIYGIKLIENWYYQQLVQSSYYGGSLDLLNVIPAYQMIYLKSNDPLHKLSAMNHCLALTRAVLTLDLPDDLRDKLDWQYEQYKAHFENLKNNPQIDERSISLARITRIGYRNAALKYMNESENAYGLITLRLMLDYKWFILAGAVTLVGGFFGYRRRAQQIASYKAKHDKKHKTPHPLMKPQAIAVQGRIERIKQPSQENQTSQSSATPSTTLNQYHESPIKRDHHRIMELCETVVNEMDETAQTLLKKDKKSIAHELYEEDILSLDADVQTTKIKNLINYRKLEEKKAQRSQVAQDSDETQDLSLHEAIQGIIDTPEPNYNSEQSVTYLIKIAELLSRHKTTQETDLKRDLGCLLEKQFKTPDETIESAFDAIHELNSPGEIVKVYCGSRQPRP